MRSPEVNRQMDVGACEVATVVILYHPPSELWAKIPALADQCKRVYLVDNTPSISVCTKDAPWGTINNVIYLPLFQNIGVSAALNLAARQALAEGCNWLLTLDQDSTVPPGYLTTFFSVLAGTPDPERVGMLCPWLGPTRSNAPPFRRVALAITSGAVMRTSLFQSVGWFDEKLFIDSVDFDYCFRMARHGFHIIQILSVTLGHCIGSPIDVPVPWGVIRSLNHSPVRRYYKFRNRIRMTQRYFWSHPRWVIRENLSGVLEVLKILAMETNKLSKIKMILRGTADGLRGRFGPAPEALTWR